MQRTAPPESIAHKYPLPASDFVAVKANDRII